MGGGHEGVLAAMRALEEAYEAVFAAARPGMTADEVDAVLAGTLKKRGAELPPGKCRSTPFVVEPGGAPPKLRVNRKPLERGKLFGMDNSVPLGGFWADLGRYGWFGRLPSELKSAHGRVLDRQDSIARQVRPGRPMQEIFDSVEHDIPFEVHLIAAEPNMRPFCGNATRGVVEEMAASTREGLAFEPGQVICIELWAGMAGGIEDMYLVEDGAAARLTRLPREIRVIGGR